MTEFELVSLAKMLVAVVLGGVIGLERQSHGRPAGLRTHILVCLGATLAMVVTQSFGASVDPGRALAGIMTGIGFLGAGAIVKSDEMVRGLTTAACVWFVAALGVVIGQGLYIIAVGSTAIALVILTLLAWFSHKIPTVNYHTVRVRASAVDLDALERRCREVFAGRELRVLAMASRISKDPRDVELTFQLRTRTSPAALEACRALLAMPDVVETRWD